MIIDLVQDIKETVSDFIKARTEKEDRREKNHPSMWKKRKRVVTFQYVIS